ncbi:MAG: ankyrin repeat domain-containing protein [Pirellula sp.]
MPDAKKRIKFAIFAFCLLCALFSGLYARNEYWKQIAFDSVRKSDMRRLTEVLPYIGIDATQKGANIRDDLTLLNLAVVESTPAIVKVLLENGANPNDASAYDRLTPLHRAVYYNRENPSAAVIVQMLLDYGADPSLRTSSGKLPMDLVSRGDPIRELLEFRTNGRSDPGITTR